MFELEKQTMEILKEINDDWVKAVKEADEEGIDTTELTGKVIHKLVLLNTKFEECKLRLENKKKKGWLA